MTTFPWHREIYGLEPVDDPVALPGHRPNEAGMRGLLLLTFDEDGAFLVRARADGTFELPSVPLDRPETRALEPVSELLEALHLCFCDATPVRLHQPPGDAALLVLRLRVPPSTPLRDDREWEWRTHPPASWPEPLRRLVDEQRELLPPLERIAVNEVEEQTEHRWRYEWIHRRLVRPVFGRGASQELQRHVLELVGHTGPVIDLACGDDTTIASWATVDAAANGPDSVPPEGDWAVANDVAFVASAATRRSASGVLFFSAHDLRCLPIRRRFAVGLLKNTLHHLPTAAAQRDLLNALLRDVVDRLVVVEIRDPHESGWLARVWNLYYRWVLGDQGETLLGAAAFAAVVQHTGMLQDHGRVETSRGTYLWAVLQRDRSTDR